MTTPKKILITGSNGAVGKAATRALQAAGHFVRGLDLAPSPLANESLTASITDAQALLQAAQNIDAIIHLAATVDDADFLTQLLPNNILGLFHILEAARLNHVPRIALASSLQVMSGIKKIPGQLTTLAQGTSPLNHYAATKIYAEQMGLLYHNAYNLEVLCPRIGWLPRNPADAQRLLDYKAQNRYLSHNDAGRFFTNFVEAQTINSPTPGYAIVFCISNPLTHLQLDPQLDPQPALTAINYTPQDQFPQGLPFPL